MAHPAPPLIDMRAELFIFINYLTEPTARTVRSERNIFTMMAGEHINPVVPYFVPQILNAVWGPLTSTINLREA